ncbi:phage pre-tape measure protein [Pararhodospirillum photometricum]|uniref:phage pre-tape measure protein n=1 Tax=Pararhodospirillum photometricum TaxID=1084 RepID=UPI0002E4C802|nr:hypothetical protein [Pararhodospirillum photometricum]
MTTLLDIAPATRSVAVGDTSLTVGGLTVTDIAGLVRPFHGLASAFDGGEIDAEALLAQGPAVVGAVLACATGTPGNPQAEAIGARLPAGHEVELLAAVVEMTFPGEDPAGVVEHLAGLLKKAGPVMAQVPSSPLPSNA